MVQRTIGKAYLGPETNAASKCHGQQATNHYLPYSPAENSPVTTPNIANLGRCGRAMRPKTQMQAIAQMRLKVQSANAAQVQLQFWSHVGPDVSSTTSARATCYQRISAHAGMLLASMADILLVV